MEPRTRLFTLQEYSRLQGKSKETILKAAKEGYIHIIQGDNGGHSYVVEHINDPVLKEMSERIKYLESVISNMARHFNVPMKC